MALKLVHDSNIEELPVYNFQDLAACARRFADQLEAGEQGEPFRIILVCQSDDGLAISGWGESFSSYELMGLFEAAKLRAFAADAIADE